MLKLVVFLFILPLALAGSCESPKYSSSTFSTLDGFFHFATTYIVEFSIQCTNNIRNIQFYAVINDKTYYVSASEETPKFQVSWQLEHADSGSQTFDINIYDEDKFALYQKAKNEDNKNVEPLFTISHYHAGISRKAPISVESVLFVVLCIIVYYAITLKNQFKN